jgi:hypothetical protein
MVYLKYIVKTVKYNYSIHEKKKTIMNFKKLTIENNINI